PDRTCPSLRASLRIGRACAIRAARLLQASCDGTVRCHYGITGRCATLGPSAAAHAFPHAERIAKATRSAQRAYTQKQRPLNPAEGARIRPPAAPSRK